MSFKSGTKGQGRGEVRAKVVNMMRWYVQDEVNQDYSEHNEVDGTKKELIPQVRWGDACLKNMYRWSWSVHKAGLFQFDL